ncbi:hypothetical protein D9757_010705 [Collybiopsis confluens]|uniref:HTH CENPB-type domain-containing protein n=1 Tax=Collybiopsis confluens TaxID=2823264 RepID=A0A8H5H970_9AGAR|nr:hypothetical protein D9757_010705 [Collybiopsis confluens]
MVRHAESDNNKSQRASEAKIALQKRAVEAYQEELAWRNLGLPNLVGAKAICNRFTNLHRAETGQIIKLNYATIINHAKGKPTRAESNAARTWLTAGKIEAVIAYIIEVANQGFPLSHRRLKEHVDEILRGRLGDDFPVSGVGKKWTQHFVRKYSDYIYTTWSSPLDEKRGRAVNPHTNEAYFNLLRKTILKHDISKKIPTRQMKLALLKHRVHESRSLGVDGKARITNKLEAAARTPPSLSQSVLMVHRHLRL